MTPTDPKQPVTVKSFMTRLLYLSVVLLVQGCVGEATCDGDHEAVLSAKSLTNERLAALYDDSMAVLQAEHSDDVSTIPTEFSGLNPIYVRKLGDNILDIKLAGCFDHGVFLRIDTVSHQVTVRYGEGPTSGEEILWTDDSA